jgi:hypothetical protein
MSTIKVNKLEQRSGTTVTVGGGACKTAVIDATTVTLGRCGASVALASGASQTGFGRTGTVDWQTGSIKTSTFTAANGEGYFANTAGGAFTMNLPAGTAGAIVSVVDYGDNFATNALTVSPNGSDKISGDAGNAILTTEGQSVTLVFVDSTEGWVTVNDSTENIKLNPNILATGGTITQQGDDKVHTFTGPGTFQVQNISTTTANNTVSYMVVAGGGGGRQSYAGGGGAGGYREVKSPTTPYTASPLDGYATPANRVAITVTSFPITVGAGGVGQGPSTSPTNGSNSVFSTITSAGGGKSCGTDGNPGRPGANGGSGGGNGHRGSEGGAGNTPPVTPPQGNNGGSSGPTGFAGDGGGGAGAAGSAGSASCYSSTSGAGGAGTATSIDGTPTLRAGGGGGGGWTSSGSAGGPGGGGAGGPSPGQPGVDGTTNTGGGGGGGSGASPGGGAGGSGIVIIRYKSN